MKDRDELRYLLLIVFIVIGGLQVIAQSNFLIEVGECDSIYSDILNENRDFWVQVPESYNPDSPMKYPVVFVLDGGVHMNAVSTVHNYYSGGYIPEMVIVGISNRNNRTRDLTTSKLSMRRGRAYTQEHGEADNFLRFIEKELIPYIDLKYPTTNYRTLIGHSYAGLFTINALMHDSTLFNNYLAIDPSLDWDDQKLLKEGLEILKTKNLKGKSLFMSLAGQLHRQDSDVTIDNVMQDTSEFSLFARSNIQFSKLVEKNNPSGLNLKWKFYESDIHGTIPLPSIMDGLIHLFDWYPIEHTDMFNNPATPTNELVELIRNRGNKLKQNFGYTVPPFEEDLLNMLGYMSLDMGMPDKSLAYFNLNVEYYPHSANVYDSIADYYIAQDDAVNTLKNLKKAYEISGNELYKSRIEEIKAR